MSDILAPQELARKEALLLSGQRGLSDGAQLAIRCAECILARTPEDDKTTPYFTTTEIQRCTGVTDTVAGHTMQLIAKAGYLTQGRIPATVLQGRQGRASAFMPRPQDGETFFRPARAPGCDRTTEQAVIEALLPGQRRILACIAHLATRQEEHGAGITRPGVRACTGANFQTLGSFFEVLMHAGLLEKTAPERHGSDRLPAQFALTQAGRQLTDTLEPLPECRPGPEVSVRLHPRILEMVERNYDESLRRGVISMLQRLISQNIVQALPSDRTTTAAEDKCLGFSPQTVAILDGYQLYALSYWSGLNKLLQHQDIPHEDLRERLGVPDDIELTTYIRTRIYLPLVASLTRNGE